MDRRSLIELDVPLGGDSDPIDVVRDERERLVVRHGPSLREILDFDDLERSRFMASTGPSGHRLSPYDANLFERWTRVASVPMRMRREAVEQGAVGTLRLIPLPIPGSGRPST